MLYILILIRELHYKHVVLSQLFVYCLLSALHLIAHNLSVGICPVRHCIPNTQPGTWPIIALNNYLLKNTTDLGILKL